MFNDKNIPFIKLQISNLYPVAVNWWGRIIFRKNSIYHLQLSVDITLKAAVSFWKAIEQNRQTFRIEVLDLVNRIVSYEYWICRLFSDLELYCTCILLLKRPNCLRNYLVSAFHVIFKARMAAIKKKVIVLSLKITLRLLRFL